MAISVPALTTVRAARTSSSVGFNDSGSATSSHATCLIAGKTIRFACAGISLSFSVRRGASPQRGAHYTAHGRRETPRCARRASPLGPGLVFEEHRAQQEEWSGGVRVLTDIREL